jgi:hypothetical protein
VFPHNAAFIPDSSAAGSAALARCAVAANFTMDTINAAGTPCPETSAIKIPACCSSATRKS